LAKPLESRKGSGAGATFQMAIAPAPVLNFKLSSGSGQNAQLRRCGLAALEYFHKSSERNISVVIQLLISAF